MKTAVLVLAHFITTINWSAVLKLLLNTKSADDVSLNDEFVLQSYKHLQQIEVNDKTIKSYYLITL